VRRLVVVDVSVRVIFHAVMVGSVYFLFVGHNQPGGGFVGGLTAGAAIGLRYVAGGIDEVRTLSRFAPWTILGAGLLVAVLTAATPLAFGDSVLSSAQFDLDLPLLGEVHVTSALLFDIGVYLVIVGLVLMVFEAFGDDVEPLEGPR
jgi:multicomponent Na+:H+ antiporter subunit A